MIPIKSPEEIKIMMEGGRILAGVMKEIEKQVKPGVATKELDKVAQDLVLRLGAKPAFLGYVDEKDKSSKPFPAGLCTSINEEIVHTLPSSRVLKEGDIITLDFGVFYKDFYTDMAITLPVGKVSPEVQRLIRVTKKALKRGIKKARVGNTFGDIGNTIQRYVEDQGFGVVRELCGHGIGKKLHEDPQIPNYGKRRSGPELAEGMVFCLEPMVTVGDWKLKKSRDDFGLATKDGSLSAHFEDTLAIINGRAQILTKI